MATTLSNMHTLFDAGDRRSTVGAATATSSTGSNVDDAGALLSELGVVSRRYRQTGTRWVPWSFAPKLRRTQYWHGVTVSPEAAPTSTTSCHSARHITTKSTKTAGPSSSEQRIKTGTGRAAHGRALEIRRPDGQLHTVGDPPTRKPQPGVETWQGPGPQTVD